MSLQEYLLGRLSIEARTLTLDEVLDRVGERSGGRASLDVVLLTADRRLAHAPGATCSVEIV
jgi:hypothetical protein